MILSLLLYGIQLLVLLFLASFIPEIVAARKQITRFSKRYCRMLILSLSALIACILFLTYHPIVYCPEHLKGTFTDEMQDLSRSLNSGLYSWQCPAFPFLICVREISVYGEVYVETYYGFFGGSTEMVFGGRDVPSIVKPLLGVS